MSKQINKSEARTFLEAHGWRFMGYNARTGRAYYTNLNINTMYTYTQHQAMHLTSDIMQALAYNELKYVPQIVKNHERRARFSK